MKAVRIFHFHAHDVNESLRHIVVPYIIFDVKKIMQLIKGTRTIIVTEPDNESKYREEIENVYNELLHWKRNLFDLPKGVPRKAFANELTKHINEWSSKSPNRDICLKTLMVMSSLILQRTSNKCKMSEIKSHVERRLNL